MAQQKSTRRRKIDLVQPESDAPAAEDAPAVAEESVTPADVSATAPDASPEPEQPDVSAGPVSRDDSADESAPAPVPPHVATEDFRAMLRQQLIRVSAGDVINPIDVPYLLAQGAPIEPVSTDGDAD